MNRVIYIVPCCRYLLGLQTTRLNCLQSFISDSTNRYYNHSLQWAQTPWYLVSGRSVDIFSPRRLAADSLDSSSRRLAASSWRLVSYSSTDSCCRDPGLKVDICRPKIRQLAVQFTLPSRRVCYLGDFQQLAVFVATEVFLLLVHCVTVDLFTSCCIAALITVYLAVA
jgi:hypothetical protein